MSMPKTKKNRSTNPLVDDRGRLAADELGLYLDEISRHDLLTADEEVGLAQEMEAGEKARRRLESKDAITTAERKRLESALRAGRQARERFVQANLRLVVANARRYAGGNVSMLDLIQEGNLGLITAVERFDWRKGFKFSTYATWWIRQAMQRAQANLGDNIRIPTGIFEIIPTVRRSAEDLRVKLGRAPTPDEISEETGIEVNDVQRALSAVTTVALETPVGEDGAALADFIADDDATDPSEEVEARILSDALHRALGLLPDIQQRALGLRFGLDGDSPATISSIAEQLGMPEHQVRELIAEATRSLADLLDEVEEMRAA